MEINNEWRGFLTDLATFLANSARVESVRFDEPPEPVSEFDHQLLMMAHEIRSRIAAAPQLSRTQHTLTRAEWVERFKARFVSVINPQEGEYPGVIEAELESWPDPVTDTDNDWRDELPEDACDENLSYWSE